MTSGFDEVLEEPRDRTKWIWLGVVAGVGVMILALWLAGRQRSGGLSYVRARHILIQFNAADPASRDAALQLIMDVRRRLQNGESFSKLAREFSDDTYSRARGGDLGYERKGIYEGPFEEYLWSAPVGQLSDVITTKHGFHLIIVEDRQLSDAEAYEQKRIEQLNTKEPAAGAQEPGSSAPSPPPASELPKPPDAAPPAKAPAQ